MRKKSSFKQYFRHITFKIKPLLFILFLSLFIFLLLQVLNSFYQVKTIQIQGNVNKNKIRGLENLKGQNLIFISDGYIIQTIEDNNPEIELDEAELIYPNKILLKLKPVETVAQLKLNQGFAVLSPDGRIIKKIKQPEKYPIINFYQQFDALQIIPGNRLNYKEIILVLYLLSKAQNLDLKIEDVDISGLNMIIFNLSKQSSESEGKKIYFSAEKAQEKQAFEFETLIRQFKIEARDFKILDLRFDKPIIKF